MSTIIEHMGTVLEQLPQLALEAFTLGHAVPRFLGRVIDTQAQRPLEHHVLEPAKQWLQERFRQIRSSNRGHDSSPVQLPQNHHLERAYLRAWQQSVRMLKEAIGLRLKPDQRKAPLADQAQLEWWDKFNDLTAFTSDDDRIKFEPPESDAFQKPLTLSESFQAFVDQVLLDQRQLALLVDDSADGDVGLRHQIQFLDWTRNQIRQEGEPELFEDFLRNGIPVEWLSNERLMLWQLIQYFFQDDLKHDSPAFVGYVARMLATLITRPNESKLSDEGKRELREEIEKLAHRFENTLTPILTESFARLQQEIQPLHKKLDAFLQELAQQTQTLKEIKATANDISQQQAEHRAANQQADEKNYALLVDIKNSVTSRPSSEPVLVPEEITEPLPYLPPKPLLCIGRQEQIAWLEDVWDRHQPPPVCLLGQAGIGKSTLATWVLHSRRVEDRYRGRRYFVRCDAAASAEGLLSAVAIALRVTSQTDLADAVYVELRRSPAVLVLDNAEVPCQCDESSLVHELLRRWSQIPGLAFALTMRGDAFPTGVSWELSKALDLLRPDDARKMFLELTRGRFENDFDLQGLLQDVEWLPLAIDLLACASLAENNLNAVRKRYAARPLQTAVCSTSKNSDRHASLEAAYRVSLESPLMTKPAKRALAVLATFPDGVAEADWPAAFGSEADEALPPLRALGLLVVRQL